MKRKIIQIATCGVANTRNTQCDQIILALCDDGTLWGKDNVSADWEQIPTVPYREIPDGTLVAATTQKVQ